MSKSCRGFVMPTSVRFQVHPASFLKLLLGIGFALTLLSFMVQVVFYQAPEFRGLNSLVDFTNVDGENSVPSWYSSVQLFVCSVVLFVIAGLERRASRSQTRGWSGLAVIFFCYLSTRRFSFMSWSVMCWKKPSTHPDFSTLPGSFQLRYSFLF